ncbi:hypothetical protein L596_008465 [Steinernema carpocapsae]|uniref:RRM domain-containing protein n=1 Tax=Steinernema carpocapsae TaxID=34508 RepID=A0A4U5PCQ2_STECR|nr:hypothetical protein L596_008465 [Steinernema carpocapsae]
MSSTTTFVSAEEMEIINALVADLVEKTTKMEEFHRTPKLTLSPNFVPGRTTRFPTMEEKIECDQRSVYVGNVDYAATKDQLKAHFENAGKVVRATIMLNKADLTPRGFGYVEFESAVSVAKALLELNGSKINNRKINVKPKRTNVPGHSVVTPKFLSKKPQEGATQVGSRLSGRLSKMPAVPRSSRTVQ